MSIHVGPFGELQGKVAKNRRYDKEYSDKGCGVV